MKRAPAAALSVWLAALPALAGDGGLARAVANPVSAIPLASLSATRDRPLFSPSRRPPPPAAATDEPAPPQPSASLALVLLGTVIGPSDRVAVVARGDGPPASLRVGERSWGWRLLAVDPRSATFEGFGRTINLELDPVVTPAAPAKTSPDERAAAASPP